MLAGVEDRLARSSPQKKTSVSIRAVYTLDMATTATPAKLSDGSWGVRTSERVVAGATVLVTTRAGKSWTAQVREVVWTDGSVCIARTADTGAKPARKSRGFTGYKSAQQRQRPWDMSRSEHPWGDDL